MKQPAIYIMTNQKHGTLYTGVTSDLAKRVAQHKAKMIEGFSAQYDCTALVYYEVFDDMENAILREKQIKGGSRKKKIAMIGEFNPDWTDLYENII